MKSKNEQPKKSKNGRCTDTCFDTCSAIRFCEYPNYCVELIERIDFRNSDIHLSNQTLLELKRYGIGYDDIIKKIQSLFGGNIIVECATDVLNIDAKWLEDACPSLYDAGLPLHELDLPLHKVGLPSHKPGVILHRGDGEILAYAIATGTTLISCDQRLVIAAMILGVDVINPDPSQYDTSANDHDSKLDVLLTNAIEKSIGISKEVKKAAKEKMAKEKMAEEKLTTKLIDQFFTLKRGGKMALF